MRNETVETPGGTIALDFDRAGVLLGVEVIGATKVLDGEYFARAERVDQT